MCVCVEGLYLTLTTTFYFIYGDNIYYVLETFHILVAGLSSNSVTCVVSVNFS